MFMLLLSVMKWCTNTSSSTGKPTTDTFLFRLHYNYTCPILIIFGILVTSYQFVGNPLHCKTEKSVHKNMVESYCWVTATFTLPYQLNRPVGSHVAYPGVGVQAPDNPQRVYMAYYQYVPFILFFLGFTMFIPRWIWLAIEDNRVETITDNLPLSNILDDEEYKKRIYLAAKCFVRSLKTDNYIYAVSYMLCELLNLFVVVVDMWLLQIFLQISFLNYGWDVVQYSLQEPTNRTDPMIATFPRMTKCVYYSYGGSGTIEIIDALCVLTINNINEKIFIIIWFWLIFLAFLSVVKNIGRTISPVLPSMGPLFNRLTSKFSSKSPKLSQLKNNLKMGDLMILSFAGKNACASVFDDFLDEVTRQLTLKKQRSPIEEEPEVTTSFITEEKDRTA